MILTERFKRILLPHVDNELLKVAMNKLQIKSEEKRGKVERRFIHDICILIKNNKRLGRIKRKSLQKEIRDALVSIK